MWWGLQADERVGVMKGPAGFDIPNYKAHIMALATISRIRPLFRSWALRRPMLRNLDPIINRAVFMSGVKGVTQNAILGALEAEAGEKFTVEHVDVKIGRASCRERVSSPV